MSKKLPRNNPLISVVIPSFNKVHFIEETLKSIFNQSYKNFEVIVQDGGSTDGTLEIIKKFGSKYPKKLVCESKKDNGQADAIKKGFTKAKGEILTYINADDVYENEAFKTVSEVFLQFPKALWLAGKGKVINEDGTEIAKAVTYYKNYFLNQNNYGLLLITNYLIQPSVFLTRKGYKIINNFIDIDGIVMEYDAWLKLGQIEMPVVINRILSSFRMSGENISSNMFEVTLKKDQEISEKYTSNRLLLFLHKINNLGRQIVVHSLR